MDILELYLLTGNLGQTEKFYNEVLELPVISKDPFSISFLAGESKLIFKQANNKNPFYHFAFNIPHNKFDEAFVWMSSKVDVLNITPGNKVADFSRWNAKAFYFYDNNGSIIEFIARFTLDNASNKSFDGSSILSVSEIGLVMDNVIAEAEKLINENQLSYFIKQPPQKHFAAIGDDNGLFILATTGRDWFPTNQPSEKHWTKIKIRNNGKISIITRTDH